MPINLYRTMKQSKGKTEDKQSRGPVSEERKLRILAQIDRKKMSIREAEERFNVPRTTIQYWRRTKMAGKTLNKMGRPKLADDEALEYIRKEVKSCYHANSTTPAGKTTVDSQRNIESIISQAIHDTSKRNNRPYQGDGIDRKTRNAISEEAGL